MKPLDLSKLIYDNFVSQSVQVLSKSVSLFQNRNEANFLYLKGGMEGEKEERKDGGKETQSQKRVISLINELLVGSCELENSSLTSCLHNVLHLMAVTL